MLKIIKASINWEKALLSNQDCEVNLETVALKNIYASDEVLRLEDRCPITGYRYLLKSDIDKIKHTTLCLDKLYYSAYMFTFDFTPEAEIKVISAAKERFEKFAEICNQSVKFLEGLASV